MPHFLAHTISHASVCVCVALPIGFLKQHMRERERVALAVAVHVTTKSLRFAELEGTEPTLVDLTTLFFSLLPAAFLFPAPCSDRTQ